MALVVLSKLCRFGKPAVVTAQNQWAPFGFRKGFVSERARFSQTRLLSEVTKPPGGQKQGSGNSRTARPGQNDKRKDSNYRNRSSTNSKPGSSNGGGNVGYQNGGGNGQGQRYNRGQNSNGPRRQHQNGSGNRQVQSNNSQHQNGSGNRQVQSNNSLTSGQSGNSNNKNWARDDRSRSNQKSSDGKNFVNREGKERAQTRRNNNDNRPPASRNGDKQNGSAVQDSGKGRFQQAHKVFAAHNMVDSHSEDDNNFDDSTESSMDSDDTYDKAAAKFGKNKGKSRKHQLDEDYEDEKSSNADKRRRKSPSPQQQMTRRPKFVKETKVQPIQTAPKVSKIMIPDVMTVRELALRSNKKSIEIMKKLLELGGMEEAAAAAATGRESGSVGIKLSQPLPHNMISQLKIESKSRRRLTSSQEVSAAAESLTVNAEVAELLMADFGLDVEREVAKVQDETRTDPDVAFLQESLGLSDRSPIVTVMGHVDHGKTTLLDTLRSTHVAEGEAGGITQSVGAFKFVLGDQATVFLDTPGHEAFASMRKCGSLLTDIIVLVIAATDGVRPQTVESIELAQSVNVPLIIALTKVDMPGIDTQEAIQRISGELAIHNVTTEFYGGSVQIVPVAAVKNIGLQELSEAIALQAEELNLKASFTSRGEAVVLESRLNKGIGSVADVVTRWGTLRVGDHIVCGEQAGRVRQMLDTVTGNPMKTAPPSTPLRLIGLSEPATPGTDVLVVPNAKRAKEVADLRKKRRQDIEAEAVAREQQAAKVAAGQPTGGEDSARAPVSVPILLKADTDGSMEALRYSVDAMNAEFIENGLGENSGFQVIRRSVGEVTSSDVELAKAFGARIFAFNVRVPTKIGKEALQAKVQIVTQSVIYHLLDDLKSLVQERIPGEKEIVVLGKARVVKVFTMNPRRRSESTWNVAGCSVVDGKISKSSRLRVRRNEEIIHQSGLDSLRHFKQDVNEVTKGQECGISLSSFQDFHPDDIIEAYEER